MGLNKTGMFVRSGGKYKSKNNNGFTVQVTGVKVEYKLVTETGQTLEASTQLVDMWKFRKDFAELEVTLPSKTEGKGQKNEHSRTSSNDSKSSDRSAKGSGNSDASDRDSSRPMQSS